MRFWRRDPAPAQDSDLRLVVGLGNPGAKFAGTRHNVGFLVVEELGRRLGARFSGSKQRAEVARGALNGIPVVLALPVTYMNESGNAVSRLVQYYHVSLAQVLIVCDDLDLPFGTIRLRPNGSSGGQRGLQSIIRALGTSDFARLRLGLGRPPGSAVNYVLSRFPPEEARLLPALIGVAADATTMALTDEIRVAMNQYNKDWLPDLTAASEAR